MRAIAVKHAHSRSDHEQPSVEAAVTEFRTALLQGKYTAAVDLMRVSSAAAPVEWSQHLQLLADRPEADRIAAYEQLMCICIDKQQWSGARDLWLHLIAEGLQPSETCCLKVMRAVNKLEHNYVLTLQAYDALLQLRGEPTWYAAQSAVNAASKLADVPRLTQVLETAAVAGLQLQQWAYLTSLKVFSEAACWQESLDCLDTLLEGNVSAVDAAAAYSYAMHAFSASGHWRQALRLLREMQQAKRQVRPKHYSAVMAEPLQQLDAESEEQRCAMIGELWQELLDSGSRPTAASFRAAVRAFSHLGEQERVVAAVDTMVQRNLFYSVAELEQAVTACIALQNTAKLFELLALPVQPAGAQLKLYEHALQLCEAHGNADLALQLQQCLAAAAAATRPDSAE
jgi:pentatricopeptide repeat protein